MIKIRFGINFNDPGCQLFIAKETVKYLEKGWSKIEDEKYLGFVSPNGQYNGWNKQNGLFLSFSKQWMSNLKALQESDTV